MLITCAASCFCTCHQGQLGNLALMGTLTMGDTQHEPFSLALACRICEWCDHQSRHLSPDTPKQRVSWGSCAWHPGTMCHSWLSTDYCNFKRVSWIWDLRLVFNRPQSNGPSSKSSSRSWVRTYLILFPLDSWNPSFWTWALSRWNHNSPRKKKFLSLPLFFLSFPCEGKMGGLRPDFPAFLSVLKGPSGATAETLGTCPQLLDFVLC